MPVNGPDFFPPWDSPASRLYCSWIWFWRLKVGPPSCGAASVDDDFDGRRWPTDFVVECFGWSPPRGCGWVHEGRLPGGAGGAGRD